jgi:2-octaprenyl-6-methoxyphenol hydroxylase
MTQNTYDILIVGAGTVGSTLALALADQPLKVGIIEAQAPFSLDAIKTNKDERAIALTHASVRLFQSLDVWQSLAPSSTPIHHVHVSDAGRFGRVKFTARDVKQPFLGQVASAYHLLDKLQAAVTAKAHIATHYQTKLQQIERTEVGYTLEVNCAGKSEMLATRLLVAADGTQSFTRKLLGIASKTNDYHQNAIVATLQLSKPHQGIAYERFTSSGPVAALPVADDRCVLIWTVPDYKAEKIMQLSDEAFCEKLQSLWGYKLGRIQPLEKRHTYPLRSVFAEQQVLPSAILLGNAAHTLHPVAAQGLNLSLKDIAVLAEMMKQSIGNQQDPTRYALLEQYAHTRKKEQALITNFTHSLVQLFSNEISTVAWGRNLGLSSLNLLPFAQKIFSRKAMGLSGRLPELMRR